MIHVLVTQNISMYLWLFFFLSKHSKFISFRCGFSVFRKLLKTRMRMCGGSRLAYVKMKPLNVIPFEKNEVGRYVALHGRHAK
jgi:hypothetical protein